jgi:hypothetical protein
LPFARRAFAPINDGHDRTREAATTTDVFDVPADAAARSERAAAEEVAEAPSAEVEAATEVVARRPALSLLRERVIGEECD